VQYAGWWRVHGCEGWAQTKCEEWEEEEEEEEGESE
jgi:hypothetical protein